MYYQSADFKYILEELISIFHQTAIFKITNNLNDSVYAESIKNLSQKYNEEEIQILYQIGVTNLRDIELAPDYKSGFEMALVRMILFTPFKFDNNLKVDKNEDKVNSRELENDRSIPKKKILEKNNEPSNETFSLEKNWDIIVKRLDADSITKNLANNISFESKNDNILNFLISESLLSVATEKSKSKLQEALSNYFKKTINIKIIVSDKELLTLHKKNEEEYNNKIIDADEQIESDNFIKTIKEKFNATTVKNSIQIKD
jgi:DNA polymerase-3 subunit gamma/tau